MQQTTQPQINISVNVGANASVIFNATQHLAALSIADGGVAMMAAVPHSAIINTASINSDIPRVDQ